MPHAIVSRFQRGKARHLRRAMTRAEIRLWRHLKAHRLNGLAFRRQAFIGNYIVDFVSHAHRLVIELDGESHDFESRQNADARRDAWFASRGYRALRFTNDEVMKDLEGVVHVIAEAASRSETPPSLSLPRKGGGNDKTTVGD